MDQGDGNRACARASPSACNDLAVRLCDPPRVDATCLPRSQQQCATGAPDLLSQPRGLQPLRPRCSYSDSTQRYKHQRTPKHRRSSPLGTWQRLPCLLCADALRSPRFAQLGDQNAGRHASTRCNEDAPCLRLGTIRRPPRNRWRQIAERPSFSR